MRPKLRDLRYEWACILGAVCPARGCSAGLVLPEVNISAMNRHLAEVSRDVESGACAVVTLDDAGWRQTGGKLRVPGNISLLHLPPCCPELNPVGNVWQRLPRNHLNHRIT